MPKMVTVEKIEKEIAKLTAQQQLKLVENLAHHLRKTKLSVKKDRDWKGLYGLGKGLWKEDAQSYVDKLRKDRAIKTARGFLKGSRVSTEKYFQMKKEEKGLEK